MSVVPVAQPLVVRTKSRKPRRTQKATAPAPNALVYKGPTRLPQDFGSADMVTVQMNYGGSLSTNGSGVLTATLDAYSQASSSADWSNVTGTWSEYRILSYKIEAVPWNKYNQPTTNNLAPVVTMTDRANQSAPGSLLAAASYGSAKMHDPSTRWNRTIKMASSDEAGWTASTTSPAAASRLYVKVYSAGNPVSLTLYDYLSVTIVQFRGRS